MSEKESDRVALMVWVTGMLIDRYKVNQNIFDLQLAEALARQFNLQVRLSHILELKK